MTYFDKFGVEFSEDLKTLINCPSNFKGGYIVPESVSEIHAYAFSHCEGLTSITFPDNLLTIGENAFESCSSLNSLNIPNSVTTIGAFAFRNCISIKSLILGTGITEIGICVFEACRSLCEVVFPDNVTWIDLCAFSRCTSLTSIRIHKNVRYISIRAFGSCSALESIEVESGNMKYDSRLNCNAIIETATNRLILGCQNTIIPDTVTCIEFAFMWCKSLKSIIIPNGVTNIGKGSFCECTVLHTVEIPKTVTEIGQYAFEECTSLVSIVYKGSIQEWEQIKKGDMWNFMVPAEVIHCVDGDIQNSADDTYNGGKVIKIHL